MQDISIQLLLAEFGLHGDAAKTVRTEMERRALTRPGKNRIAISKRPAIEKLLTERFVRTCHKRGCRDEVLAQAAKTSLTQVDVRPSDCEICGGSDNERAVAQLSDAMRSTARTHLLVLGGSPNTQRALSQALSPPSEVRFVTTGDSHSGRTAGEYKRWADIIVIWATTPIGHKVTSHYRGSKTVTVRSRGVATLATEIVRHLGLRP